jgi:hypothetical protein
MVQNVVNHRNSNFQEIVKSTKEEKEREKHNLEVHNNVLFAHEMYGCGKQHLHKAIELCVIT